MAVFVQILVTRPAQTLRMTSEPLPADERPEVIYQPNLIRQVTALRLVYEAALRRAAAARADDDESGDAASDL